ncbi:MAG: hypothetical protein M1297_04320 [Nitrospirae bacterium]|jgi:hypothetical protein|nr:hypothetical protein [Nitrospirota bacterium]
MAEKKKTEQIQVRVNSSLTLNVKGHFDPERMAEAGKLLGEFLEVRGAGASHRESHSLALLVAIEKIYENLEYRVHIRELEDMIERRDRLIKELDDSISSLEQNAVSLLRPKG